MQQANATTTLGTLNKNIGGLQAGIDAFKPQKTQVDAGARQLQQLAAEAAAARAELARFPSNGDPFLEALAKSAAGASEEIAKINSERKQLSEKPLSLADISNASANALTIQLSRLQIESKQKEAEISKELRDGAAKLNEELAKQEVEEQKKLAVINAQTAAIRLQIDAVGKGFAAQRQVALAGITTRGTAAEERPEAIQAQIAQNTAQSDLDVKATLNQIAQQSAALKREIDAVFKGRDAVRQAEIENIRAQGLNPDIEQARISYAQAQSDLQDKQRGVGETAQQGVAQWLHEMSDATNSVGKEVHDVLGGAFQGLDKQLADIITGQKTSWSSFLRGIAAQIATLTLNNAVGNLAKQLLPQAGGGSAPGGSGGNVSSGLGAAIAAAISKIGQGALTGSSAGASGGGLFGGGTAGNGIFSFLKGSDAGTGGGAGPFSLPSLSQPKSLYGDDGGTIFDELGNFGGFMANGGPLQSSKWYIAGEHGPEPIWGGGSGAFASGYGKSGGDTINNYVDARGSSNSAETELRMRRGLAEAHRQGARDGAAVSQERRRRVPNSKAFAS